MRSVAMPWDAPAPASSLFQRLAGRRRTALGDSHRLIMAARMTALLEDFGTSGFRRRLDGLIDDVNGRLVNSNGPATARRIDRWFVELLVRRAELVDMVKKRPELSEAAVTRPVVVTGLPGAPIEDAVGQLFQRYRTLRPTGAVTDADFVTAGFGVSFAGFGFARTLGVSAPYVAPDEAAEVYRFHRLQIVGSTIDQESTEAGEPRWLFAGADHLANGATLVETYPDSAVVVVPTAPEAAVEGSVAVEADAASRLGLPFDAASSRRRWAQAVESSEVDLDRLRTSRNIEMVEVDDLLVGGRDLPG